MPQNKDNGHNIEDTAPETATMISIDDFLTEISARLITTGGAYFPENSIEPARREEQVQILSFKLNDEWFAFEVESAGEVVRDPQITPVPGLSEWVLGVTNFHGDILSVVDMSQFLNIGEAVDAGSRTMIVARVADQTIGLVVDDVGLIYTVPESLVISPPFEIPITLVDYMRGAVDRDNDFIRILDCKQLLLGQHMQQFS